MPSCRTSGAMAGFQSTNPQDINDLGQVVGISTSTTNFNSTAFSWQNRSFNSLGALVAGAASSATAVQQHRHGRRQDETTVASPYRWVSRGDPIPLPFRPA
ncbi:MAG: hypothetical protein IPK33_13060 [Gemmatimonadetes bacterium]|nr:hypothetical protein [Gemmatimonadota bacterium]